MPNLVNASVPAVRMIPPRSMVLPRDAGEDALARLLAQPLKRPMAGRPRVPRLVRIATRSDAARVLEVLPDGVAVCVAPTPELDEIVAQMAKSIGPGEVAADYLEDEHVPPEQIHDFFVSARMLYDLSPWKRIDDSQIFRIDIPDLGIAEACLSVIGGLGESLGFVLFSSFVEYDAFVTAIAESGPEPPEGFRAACLGLTFEHAADLPPEIRRRIATHSWPVAGPRAYPYLERREHDGDAVPLCERDFVIAAAIALTLSSFFAKHRREFAREVPEPQCETYAGAGQPAVTITYPYDTYELFDIEDPLDMAAADGRRDRPDASTPPPPSPRRAGRNDPCPCGSGKKYKKCHLAADESAPPTVSPATDPEDLHVLDRQLLDRMFTFARERFGDKWLRYRRDFAGSDGPETLVPHWAAYHFRVEGRPICDWYEQDCGQDLSARERGWIVAQRAAWLSIWEVLEVDAGRTITLLDLLTGATRTVLEKSGSRLTPRLLVLARIIDYGGAALIAGIHPRPLRPFAAEPALEAARTRARRRGLVPVERVRDESFGRLLLRAWAECVEQMLLTAATPPVLHNTDGDDLLLTVDVFDLEPAALAEVELRLGALDGMREIDEPDDGERSAFSLDRPAREGTGLDQVMIARLGVRGDDCTLEVATNSLWRADEARALVETALRPMARHCERPHPNADAMLATAPGPRGVVRDSNAAGNRHGPGRSGRKGKPAGPSEDEERALVREFKARHYERWLDEKIPALGNLTPRQASRTAKGLRKLDLLLRDVESHELTLPPGERYDFAIVRRQLGML